MKFEQIKPKNKEKSKCCRFLTEDGSSFMRALHLHLHPIIYTNSRKNVGYFFYTFLELYYKEKLYVLLGRSLIPKRFASENWLRIYGRGN